MTVKTENEFKEEVDAPYVQLPVWSSVWLTTTEDVLDERMDVDFEYGYRPGSMFLWGEELDQATVDSALDELINRLKQLEVVHAKNNNTAKLHRARAAYKEIETGDWEVKND
jgi:hypothetical protein